MSEELTRQEWDMKRQFLADMIRRCGGMVSAPETRTLMNAWFGDRPALIAPDPLTVYDSSGDKITLSVGSGVEVTILDTSNDESVGIAFESLVPTIEWLRQARGFGLSDD